MHFPTNFKDYLISEGFGEMATFVKPSPYESDSYIYLNSNDQETIDLNIKRHQNDYIKSNVAYHIADYVNTENCKALVLTEPESCFNKKLVKALIKGSSIFPKIKSKDKIQRYIVGTCNRVFNI